MKADLSGVIQLTYSILHIEATNNVPSSRMLAIFTSLVPIP